MAHLSEGTLRRMVDEPEAHGGDARHFETCAECQARYKTVAADARAITSLLAAPELKLDVASAFNRVRSAPAARPRFGFRLPVVRPGSRPMVLAFAAAVAAIALLATAIAEDKNTFTPQTLTPVPVTMADMESLSQLSAYGTVSWTKQPQLQVVTSAAEAKTISGLQVPAVADLPAGVSTTVTYAAMPQAVAVFTFSKDKAAAAAAQAGKTLPALPAGMEGAQLTVTVGPAVAEIYGNMNKPAASSDISQLGLPQLVVAATTAPVATSSQVTVKQLEDYLIAQPGISAELKAAIKAIGDPSTTLPVPIPVQFATSSSVTVQGVQGIALGDNTGVGAGVIWVKNGVVYGVVGTIKKSDAEDIANHLT
ncbi:MAG TPA: hypothetical protein VGS16_15990 [Candidatus Dormibacteraeota bacterium]|nr:hypothetical protein [Candidatus Dormibacteraeota bacterium]